MAKFNEKALCLFSKTYDQLNKEAERRGLRHGSRERTIAEVIWKDAYDAGVNAGKEAAVAAAPYRPANYYNNAKPEVKEYCLYDLDNAVRYRLELTKEQFSAIEWMIDHELMVDVELSEWEGTFENIGRI
jgi:hypothetical protein